jgi:hypothetical protein
MFTKTSIALAILFAITSGAVAAEKRQHSTNPAFDVYNGGKYLGSDPDSRVRAEILRDRVSD